MRQPLSGQLENRDGYDSMILNTGMRTDIPAYFSKWFINRIRAGYVLTRNPYNPLQVTRYRLDPEVVDILCFGTKNPGPLIPHLDEIGKFRTFWFVTMNPYGRELEPHVPYWKKTAGYIRELSAAFGPKAVSWRVSPIIVNDRYTVSWHIERFAWMAEALAGQVETCMIAFLDLYAKTVRNFPEGRKVTPREKAEIGKAFAEISRRNGIRLIGCYEDQDLRQYGVDVSGCLLGNDIGAYNTCPHGCRYCYANFDQYEVAANFRMHDPESPYLIGGPVKGEVIHDAHQVSWIEHQMSIFDL